MPSHLTSDLSPPGHSVYMPPLVQLPDDDNLIATVDGVALECWGQAVPVVRDVTRIVLERKKEAHGRS